MDKTLVQYSNESCRLHSSFTLCEKLPVQQAGSTYPYTGMPQYCPVAPIALKLLIGYTGLHRTDVFTHSHAYPYIYHPSLPPCACFLIPPTIQTPMKRPCFLL